MITTIVIIYLLGFCQKMKRNIHVNKLIMKTYLASKIVKAEPMTRGAFLNERYGTEPDFDDPTHKEEGYKVVYPDGYTSWSPKEPFDLSHRLITSGEVDLIEGAWKKE